MAARLWPATTLRAANANRQRAYGASAGADA